MHPLGHRVVLISHMNGDMYMNTFSHQKPQHRGHIPPPHAGHLPPKSQNRRKPPAGRTTDTQTDTPLSGAFFSAIFALPFMLLIGFVFLLIITVVSYRSTDPHALVMPLSLVALGLTSLLGGLIASRRKRGNGLLSGLLCGLLFNLVLLTLSLFWHDGDKVTLSLGLDSLVKWGLHAGIALLSVIGAKMGMGKS